MKTACTASPQLARIRALEPKSGGSIAPSPLNAEGSVTQWYDRMLECCILYSHHKNDETTQRHLEILRAQNPYPVIAVCNAATTHVDGALDVDCLSKDGSLEPKWHSPDTILYRWFLRGGIRARRYVFLEWDTLATMPVREFYAEVWEEHAAASTVKTIENDPDWYWFWQMGRLPSALRPKAAGVVPFNGLFLSHQALSAITSRPIPADIFCEFRVATLLRYAGFEPRPFPSAKQRMNSYERTLIDFHQDRPGIYHPIK